MGLFSKKPQPGDDWEGTHYRSPRQLPRDHVIVPSDDNEDGLGILPTRFTGTRVRGRSVDRLPGGGWGGRRVPQPTHRFSGPIYTPHTLPERGHSTGQEGEFVNGLNVEFHPVQAVLGSVGRRRQEKEFQRDPLQYVKPDMGGVFGLGGRKGFRQLEDPEALRKTEIMARSRARGAGKRGRALKKAGRQAVERARQGLPPDKPPTGIGRVPKKLDRETINRLADSAQHAAQVEAMGQGPGMGRIKRAGKKAARDIRRQAKGLR